MARSSAIKLAAGVAAAMLSTIGLAYAGVDLPGHAAEKALDSVLGVELPNQGGGDVEITSDGPDESADQTALDVWAVISNWSGDRGCAFGQAVANAATDGEHGPDCTKAEDAGSQGDEASAKGRATANEASAKGRATADEASAKGRASADEASAKGRASADEASSVGKSTANEASRGRSEAGEENGDSAAGRGQSNNPTPRSESGKESGETASERGQSNNPTGSGGP